ncbi:GNAT family N-acetyltransferase [Occultella glacieicola]|uniref:GNAT family N-acetyltransferase n=1 Tax=Occultella glacieicola TaxID=2518684 RepID=A0ABY2DZC3_9MICO|nr:GNAT family N-acetyltransferase [Occultella glacieicola]TDE88547.1 GNAT family N-acetyltransferase [Occultella glacieicola]
MSDFTIREVSDAEDDIAGAAHVMMRSVREDFQSEYDPTIHDDIDFLVDTYVRPVGPFMLVAVDDATGRIIATGGIRGGKLKGDTSPRHLIEAYDNPRVGQVVRVYVLREARRRGIAKAIVRAVLERAQAEGHYDKVVLHTFLHSPGAVPFWTAMGAQLVVDDTDGPTNAMFYEFGELTLSP